MSSKQRIAITIAIILIAVGVTITSVFLMQGWGVLTQVIIYGLSGVFAVGSVVLCVLKKDALLKTAFVFMLCLVVAFVALVITNNLMKLSKYKTDGEKMRVIADAIKSTGGWAMTVYVILQILQVVVLPIPAVICYVSGVLIWGANIAFGLAVLGVFIGSMLCFVIGRFAGKKLAYWIAGKDNVEKYAGIVGDKGKVPFVLMQILPFFPDDILCIIAGLSDMKFPFFLAVMLTVRPAVIAVYCYLGSGTIIPFSGWGIPVWIVIFALCIVGSILVIKYQDRINAFFKRKFVKKGNTAVGDANCVGTNEAAVDSDEKNDNDDIAVLGDEKIGDVCGGGNDTGGNDNVTVRTDTDTCGTKSGDTDDAENDTGGAEAKEPKS